MPDEENKATENTAKLEQQQDYKPVETTTETPPTPEPTTPLTVEPVVIPEPVVTTPVATPAPTTHSSASVLVLQWLTYAFWGWLILALIWLAGIVFSNAILDDSLAIGTIPFAIATSIVLLPIAFLTDYFYRKHEPLVKTGGAAIIMVIHAVLFALLGIITLIWTVFTSINLVSIVTGTTGSNPGLVSLLVTGFATLLYAAAFLRALNPFKSRKPLGIYSISMLAITILLLILVVVGPFAKAFTTRNDRVIEQNLSSVQSGVSNYIEKNQKLPDSLNDVEFNNPEAAKLVKDGSVEYKKETSVKVGTNSTSVQHRYQLCATYTAANNKNSTYNTSYRLNDDGYSEYISPSSSHGAGKECYKLQTTTYTSNSNNTDVDIDIKS